MNKSWEERLKETDQLYKERARDLTEIGISVESSGIKVRQSSGGREESRIQVEKNRFYLVNLNSDPAMNELLVYYINVRLLLLIHQLNYRFIKDPLIKVIVFSSQGSAIIGNGEQLAEVEGEGRVDIGLQV